MHELQKDLVLQLNATAKLLPHDSQAQRAKRDEVPDVEAPCFWVEAKHHNRTNIKAALRQAMEAAPKGRWPLAVCKDDRHHWWPCCSRTFWISSLA